MSTTRRQSPLAALVGSFSEAWAEVRIHRTRVLLSLIGVAVAVAAITSVVGLGAIVEQSVQVSSERNGGRPAALGISAYSNSGRAFDARDFERAFDSAVERYKIRYHTGSLNAQLSVQHVGGTSLVNTMAIDPDYGIMHRVSMREGSWFVDSDANRLAPGSVVNGPFWALMGSPDLRTHPTVRLLGAHPVSAVVIGVTAARDGNMPSMMLLTDAFRAVANAADYAGQAQFEAWVPPSMAKKLTSSADGGALRGGALRCPGAGRSAGLCRLRSRSACVTQDRGRSGSRSRAVPRGPWSGEHLARDRAPANP